MNIKRQSGFSAIEIVIGVVVVVIIGLLGWKFFSSMQSNTQKSDVADSSKTAEIDTTKLTDLADLATIQKSALDGKSDVTITGIQLKTEDGKLVYQATLSDGTVLTFDATSGAKLSEEKEKADDTAKSLPANFSGGIGLARAVEVALKAAPNSAVKEIELEEDDGTLVYHIKFTNEARVDVDATTGEVVRTKAAKKEEAHSRSKTSTESTETKNEDSTSTQENETESNTSSESKTESDSSHKSGSGSTNDDSSKDDNNDDNSGSGHDGAN